MINLACHNPTPERVAEIREQVLAELTKAGIDPVAAEDQRGEVPSKVEGKLGEFTFKRAWYYWIVSGNVPLRVAEKMYNNPNGRNDVRVSGHCGCPPPEEWVTKIDRKSKRILVEDAEFERGKVMFSDMSDTLKTWIDKHMPESQSDGYDSFVTSYHIDSQEGLNMFVETLKREGVLNPSIRHRGYYVCLEECGCFGNTYLRDHPSDWNSEFATTTYLDNATYWATPEEAEAAYKDWMSKSTSKLSETHRKKNESIK